MIQSQWQKTSGKSENMVPPRCGSSGRKVAGITDGDRFLGLWDNRRVVSGHFIYKADIERTAHQVAVSVFYRRLSRCIMVQTYWWTPESGVICSPSRWSFWDINQYTSLPDNQRQVQASPRHMGDVVGPTCKSQSHDLTWDLLAH
jgi:hypothetical protein